MTLDSNCGGQDGCHRSGRIAARLLRAENNDLWSNACGSTTGIPCSGAAATALYRDEATTDITALTGVNGLTDITASQNLSVDPSFVALAFAASPVTAVGSPPAIDIRITNTWPLGDSATSQGQPPTVDFYGNTRPVGPANDIGAHEHP